jgi:hypothetical protein
MKACLPKLLAFTIVVAVLTTATIATLAQSTPAQKHVGADDRPHGDRPDRSQRGGGKGERDGPDPIFMALDADRDGSLSQAELRNAAAALKKLDKNNDGKLTQDEIGGATRGGKGGKGGGGKKQRSVPSNNDK